MCCSIYEQRPAVCRKFAMGSEYCRDERRIYREQVQRGIPLTLRDEEQRSNDAARTVDRPRAPSRPGRHVFATHDIQEQATRMANPKPDARTRFRRSTRDGADGSSQRRLTSDRISADLADFQKAGGQVEVLGVTRVLKKLGESAGESADEKADQPAS